MIALGWALSNIWWFTSFHATSWRLFGVLQRIGIVYGACAIMFLTVDATTRVIVAARDPHPLLAADLIPSLDGLPTDLWVRGHNFVGSVDRVLLGAGNHIYVNGLEGYDPEGLAWHASGDCAGPDWHGDRRIFAARMTGTACARSRLRARSCSSLGILWGFVFPVVKDIWSSTFVLVTVGHRAACRSRA